MKNKIVFYDTFNGLSVIYVLIFFVVENGPFGSEEFVDTAENVVTALSSMSQSIYCLSEKFKFTLDELGTYSLCKNTLDVVLCFLNFYSKHCSPYSLCSDLNNSYK